MASLLAGTFFLLLQTAVNEDFSFQGDTLAWAGLREGEALGVSEGRLPFSRSSPPGHAAVRRCGGRECSDRVRNSGVSRRGGCVDLLGGG